MTRWLLVLCFTTSLAAAERRKDDPVVETPGYSCTPASAATKLALSFRPGVSVGELAKWIIGTTCKNVVFDSRVEKHVLKATIVAPNKYTPKQALELVLDAIEATGLVVTQKADTIIIKLGPNMPKACPDVAVAPPPALDPVDDALAAELVAGIKQIDPTHYEVTRTLVDKVLLHPMAVAKGARVVPAMKNGKPVGFKLYAVRPGSVYARLGFANGDTIKSTNKHALTSAEKALEVYTKLRDANQLVFELERRGKPVTLTITIK
jgi:hypothetical protein